MRRHEALAELSRDHHQALAAALVLKRAGEQDAAEAARRFLEFWREHGSLHFRIEEELLLPGYAEHADPGEEAVVRVLVDHVVIRRQAARLERGDAPVADLVALGERLEAHVRHEERVLFPRIEEALPEDELIALGQRIAAAEAGTA